MTKPADENAEAEFALPEERDDEARPAGPWLDDPSYDGGPPEALPCSGRVGMAASAVA